jgi:hypothetical protein
MLKPTAIRSIPHLRRNNAGQSQVSDLNVTMNCQGGNNTSACNWNLNADNRCKDFFFAFADPNGGRGIRRPR